MNERIRAPSVRLIGADGRQVGVVPREEALRQARVAGLDLVEVNASTVPPVCRLLDFGRYQYEQDKRERESRRKQKRLETKGVRISFKMSPHDEELRRALAEKFLKEGHRVRVDLFLRGREKALREIGAERVRTFLRRLAALATVEEDVSPSLRGFTALIAPKEREA